MIFFRPKDWLQRSIVEKQAIAVRLARFIRNPLTAALDHKAFDFHVRHAGRKVDAINVSEICGDFHISVSLDLFLGFSIILLPNRLGYLFLDYMKPKSFTKVKIEIMLVQSMGKKKTGLLFRVFTETNRRYVNLFAKKNGWDLSVKKDEKGFRVIRNSI